MPVLNTHRNIYGGITHSFNPGFVAALAAEPDDKRDRLIYDWVEQYINELFADPYTREAERYHEDLVEALSYQVSLHMELAT